MKNLLNLIFLYLCLPVSSWSQPANYRPVISLVEENKVWETEVYWCMDRSGNTNPKRYVMKGDTLIGFHTYKKIQVQPYCDQYLFMRETDTFYWNRHDPFSSARPIVQTPDAGLFVYILYPGDRYETLLYYWQHKFAVQHIFRVYKDSIQLFYYDKVNSHNPQYYVPISQVAPAQTVFPRQDTWQEGIGSLQAFIYNEPYFTQSHTFLLRCVKRNDTLLYSNGNCLPDFLADATASGFCSGDTTRIDLHCCEMLDSVVWDFGDGTSTQLPGHVRSQAHYYANPGDYDIRLSAWLNGNQYAINRYITVRPKPAPAQLGNDTLICGGSSLEIRAGTQAYKYLWSTGDTTDKITVTQSGTFTLMAGHQTCLVHDTIQVTFSRQPLLNLDTLYRICPGDSQYVHLGSWNIAMSYAWSHGGNGLFDYLKDTGSYWVKITSNGCQDSSDFRLEYKPLPGGFETDTLYTCSDQPVLIRGNGRLMELNGLQDTVFYLLPDTSWKIRFFQSGCSLTDSLTIRNKSVVLPRITADTFACTGDTLHLNIPLSANEQLIWEDGQTGAFRSWPVLQSYPLSYRIHNTYCQATDTLNILAHPLPPSLYKDTVFVMCPGEKVSVPIGQGYSVETDRRLYQDSFPITKTGTTTIRVHNVHGCSLMEKVYVRETQPPSLLDSQVCVNLGLPTVQLPAGFAFVIPETNTTRVVDSLIIGKMGVYTFYRLEDHCTAPYLRLEVLDDCEIFLPNSFSPDGNGLNDAFLFDFGTRIMKARIYDRWGACIYSEEGSQLSWDGSYNGKPCPTGIYFYELMFDTPFISNRQSFRGTITLLR